ncbi:MAG: CDP-diacylglycerol--glycerol-3-phosphate 3-phosphatidyltransferase [Pontiellaceae bacterium]|nr:CDP-diacylglycerol--glycerol-3-phosphate 3-phosphatidyltransferase [Kiritimatiellaceae bacterium]HBO87988.1 CDP-diacylglycerol--glycerol-3-phosphate 3-phosphatidyltransferase [Verrucomicrobiota bacterium]
MAPRINWANQLTIARFWMAGVMMICLSLNTSSAALGAFILFVIASVTDALDGWLARRVYGCSTFGKLMDPLADKVLTAAAFVALVEKGSLAAWMVTLILMRELMITGIRFVLSEANIVLAADKWGKWKTAVQMIVIILLLGGLVWPELGFPAPQSSLASVLGYITVFFTLLSGITYFYRYRDHLSIDADS